MKFPVLWSGVGCYTVKCSEILAHIELLYNPRVSKVFTSLINESFNNVITPKEVFSLSFSITGKRAFQTGRVLAGITASYFSSEHYME